MPLPPIDFADYHRTVLGYHGTTRDAAIRLVSGEAFNQSDEDNEWFGEGIYFWEHAFRQAWWWARRKDRQNPAVIGAVLRLGNCFDLLDPINVEILRQYHQEMVAEMAAIGVVIPVNVRSHRKTGSRGF